MEWLKALFKEIAIILLAYENGKKSVVIKQNKSHNENMRKVENGRDKLKDEEYVKKLDNRFKRN